MSYTLNLWTGFSKRINSTKRPTATPTYVKSVTLKEETDIDNPTFLLDGAIDMSVCYAQCFGNYYFIDKITSVRSNLWAITCTLDELATYKTNVGSTQAYIEYAASGYDNKIVDSRIACKTTKTITYSDPTSPVTKFDVTGCYIMSICNKDGGKTGFLSQYVLNGTYLAALAAYFSNTDLSAENLLKNFTKPFESVVSCIWLPVNYTDASGLGTSKTISFGGKESTASAPHLNSTILTWTESVSIPWTYSDFRRAEPYSTIQLYIPLYGIVPLNASDLATYSYVSIKYYCDISVGDVTVEIYAENTPTIIMTIQYNVASPCPISQISQNIVGTVGSGAATLGSVASGVAMAATGNLPGAAASISATIAAGFNTVLNANQRPTSVKGVNGGRGVSQLLKESRLWVFSVDTEDPDAAGYLARFGRPIAKVGTISSYSGFVKTTGASVSIAGMIGEASNLNSLLNSGIFYE